MVLGVVLASHKTDRSPYVDICSGAVAAGEGVKEATKEGREVSCWYHAAERVQAIRWCCEGGAVVMTVEGVVSASHETIILNRILHLKRGRVGSGQDGQ